MTKPTEWKQIRLADSCLKIGSGITPRGGESVYMEDGIPLIRSQNVYNNAFYFPGLAFINAEQGLKMKGATVETRDVLLNITGDSVARCCIVPDSLTPARVNQHVAILRPNINILIPEFLNYYLTSPWMQSYMLSLAGSGGTRKALTKGTIEQFEIPSPPLPTQKRISDILSAYDDLIENNRRRMALLEQSASELYREWFVRLRFPGHEHCKITKGLPAGWKRNNLEEAFILQRGYDLTQAERRDGDIPVYGSNGQNGWHDTSKARAPGVVTGRSGTLGKVTFVYDDYWPHNTSLWVKEFKRVSPYFTYFKLLELGLEQFNGGASVPTLDRKAVHRVEIVIPAKPTIKLFDEQVEAVFTQVNKLEQQNQKLRTARDLLLPKLMNGEIAV